MAKLEVSSVVVGELIASVAEGDSAALAELYARLRDPLAAYLTLIVRDSSLREEVIQDTFLAVWNGAGRFRGESSIRSWVFGIARRRAIDALRRTKTPLMVDIDERDRVDQAPGPEETVIANYEAAEIRSAIERIAAIHQEVLMLIFTQGLSYAETAAILSVPVGTVKSRLSNARWSLRNELGARAGERHDR
jgi:RNA polymerase sigma-70 factor (ECF subfamily)